MDNIPQGSKGKRVNHSVDLTDVLAYMGMHGYSYEIIHAHFNHGCYNYIFCSSRAVSSLRQSIVCYGRLSDSEFIIHTRRGTSFVVSLNQGIEGVS